MDKKETNNYFGIISVIFGILSVVFIIGLNFHGAILGVLGIIFALIQRKNMKNKWYILGINLNIIGLIINVFFLIVITAAIFNQVQQLQSSGFFDQINQVNQLQQLQNLPQNGQ